MLIYFTLFFDETRAFLQLLPKLGLYSSLSDIKFDTNISNRLYSFGKLTGTPLCTNVPVVLYIGIIQLRLYDNLFFSSRKESKELMLKETASPLNGFFYFDFLGERGFKGNIYRCLLPQYQLKKIKFFIYTLPH